MDEKKIFELALDCMWCGSCCVLYSETETKAVIEASRNKAVREVVGLVPT